MRVSGIAREGSDVGDTRREESAEHGAYAFGPFVADPVKRQLWRDGSGVPITSKTFDLLVVLLEHRDRIVSKDELLNRVWPNTAVNENNLARQISSLRRALGERPDQHEYVVTVSGHGYRFVASVQDLPDALPELHPGPSTAPAARSDIRLHVPPEPASNAQDHRGGDEPLSHQPIPDVSHVDPALLTGWNGRWAFVGMVVATGLAILATGGAVALLRPSLPHPEPRRTLQRITYDEAALPRDAAWASDGQWVVYASDRAGNAELWKQRL